MTPVYLNAMGVVSALGFGQQALREGIFALAPSGLKMTDRFTPGRMLHLGYVSNDIPILQEKIPLKYRSRSNALLAMAMNQIQFEMASVISRFGSDRVAIVLGASAVGLTESEHAISWRLKHNKWPVDFDYAQQEMGNAAAFCTHVLGTCGPSHVISTACSSGAKAMASGARLLHAGLADAVMVGGFDALGKTTIEGFSALESVSENRCNPMSLNRCGINIGEGAALFLMTRDPGPVRLAGYGETSDAHHMTAPDPGGRGAIKAMQYAMASAKITSKDVDYLNLHGTATVQNDAMESRAVHKIFGAALPVSSTKPVTGHTLAAAGAIEAAIAWITLVDNPHGKLPPHWWDGQHDPLLPHLNLVVSKQTLGYVPKYVMSNSFAFGGSNATLLLAGA